MSLYKRKNRSKLIRTMHDSKQCQSSPNLGLEHVTSEEGAQIHGPRYAPLHLVWIIVPSVPYKPDFSEKIFQREYTKIFENLNEQNDEKLSHTFLEQYVYEQNLPLSAFNLVPKSSTYCSVLAPAKRGSVRINLNFKEQTSDSLFLMVYCQYESLIQIDKFRNV